MGWSHMDPPNRETPEPRQENPIEEIRAVWDDIKTTTESVRRLFKHRSDTPLKNKTKSKFRLAESPWLWGPLGVIFGTAASLAGSYFVGWIFFFAWVCISGAFIRHLLEDRSFGVRVLGNLVAIPALGLGLYLFRGVIIKHMPAPPPTAEENAKASEQRMCTLYPWLCTKPETSTIEQGSVHAAACHIGIAENADAVTRMYMLHNIGDNPTMRELPQFQELFYEWKALLSVDRNTRELSVKVNHLAASDVLSTTPAIANISDLTPEWMSGFREHAKSKADYYSRIVTFYSLSKGDKAVIVARRALGSPAISQAELLRVQDARTPDCSARIPPMSQMDESNKTKAINARLSSLAGFKWGRVNGPPAPLPLGRDPGETGDNSEFTLEGRCQNEACDHVTVGQLEVRVGKPPQTQVPSVIVRPPAYMQVDKVKLTGMGIPIRPVVEVYYGNYHGQAPADLQFADAKPFFISDPPSPAIENNLFSEFQKSVPSKLTTIIQMGIGDGSVMQTSVSEIKAENVNNDLFGGGKWLYIIGAVIWKDPIGEHRKGICYYLWPPNIRRPIPSELTSFAPLERWMACNPDAMKRWEASE